jgi:hypothetical protein
MTDGQMTDTERALVVQLLRQTQDDFLSAVERLTDAQWDFRPAADRWSIGLVGEHLGLVERGLFGRAQRALEHEPHPDGPSATAGKDALIGTMLADRESRRNAPDPVVPTGTATIIGRRWARSTPTSGCSTSRYITSDTCARSRRSKRRPGTPLGTDPRMSRSPSRCRCRSRRGSPSAALSRTL